MRLADTLEDCRMAARRAAACIELAQDSARPRNKVEYLRRAAPLLVNAAADIAAVLGDGQTAGVDRPTTRGNQIKREGVIERVAA